MRNGCSMTAQATSLHWSHANHLNSSGTATRAIGHQVTSRYHATQRRDDMAKSKRRKKIQSIKESGRKAYKRSKEYLSGKAQSRYAKKRAYCIKHQVWGFEVPFPKPW